MESESSVCVNDDTTTASAWTSATNWTSVRGTLVNSITFDSSLSPSPIDDETAHLNPTAKRRPLILKPTSPDSGPCELTISFAQKHELGQIYVKSTARVYEIYCASDLQSDREYLCTVRCGAAARDDDDDEEALSAYSNGSRDNPLKENSGNESNRSSSEDEWVEVKVPASSLALIKPEYHEATAQMSDVNPCLSITIRLLSVQSKDVVFIDEVYVFADPVDTSDSESQAAQTENSNGNSIMAMLMPTLLQMSKTKGSTRSEEKNAFETWTKPSIHESASEATCSSSTNDATRVQKDGRLSMDNNHEVEFQSVNQAGVDATGLQGPPQVSLGEIKAGDHPTNDRVEKGLDQLFTRMGRLEDLFLRLEENLLKPINSIEARLDRVEQQLEVLTNKQKNSELPSYSRFCAPNFSSINSDSNSFYRSEIEYSRFEEFESNAKSIHSDLQTNQADDVSDNANGTQMLPTLVFTAPDFSNCDDDDNEEEIQASDRVTETSVEEVRRPLTVDDALASALAGLVSSVSIQMQNHTPALSVKAPDFPNEEDTNDDKKDSPRGQPDVGAHGTESEIGLLSSSLSNASHPPVEGDMNAVQSLDHDQSEKTTEEVDVRTKHCKEGDEDGSSSKSIDKNEDIENELSAKGNENEDLVHDKTDIQDELIPNQTDAIGSDAKPTDAKSCADTASSVELSKDGSEDKESDALRDIMALSQAASSVVNFESPVLDVKFLSQDSRGSSFSLEALLSDLPESQLGEAICAEESHDMTPSHDKHSELISVEHGEPLGPAFSNQIIVDFNYCSLQEQEPLHNDDETPQLAANNIPCSHEDFPQSLI